MNLLAGVGFDLNKTLNDYSLPESARIIAFKFVLEKLASEGREVNPDLLENASILGKKFDVEADRSLMIQTYKELLGDEAIAEKAANYHHYYYDEKLPKKVKEIEGAAETLRYLKARGIPFFIASNNTQVRTKRQVHYTFNGEFDDIPCIGCDVTGEQGKSKPDPEMIKKGFQAIGVTPNRTNSVYIGNSPGNDIPAAIAAGTQPILFSPASIKKRNLGEQIGKLTLTSYPDLDAETDQINVAFDGSSFHVPYVRDHKALLQLLGQRMTEPTKLRYIASKHSDVNSFVRRIQLGQSVEDLFNNIAAKQTKLVEETVRTCVWLIAEETDKLAEADNMYLSLRDKSINDAELVANFNHFSDLHSGLGIQIITKGHKSRERIEEKAASHLMPQNTITDLIRVTVTADLPETLTAVSNHLARNHESFRNNFYMKPSGLISSDFKVAINGMAGSVHLAEKLQTEANAISHRIYEIMRSCTFKNGVCTLSPGKVNDYRLLRNDIYTMMQNPDLELPKDNEKLFFFQDNDNAITFFSKFLNDVKQHEDIKIDLPELKNQPAESDIDNAMHALLKLHQLVHVAFISKSRAEWKEKYLILAKEMNQAAGEEIMPEAYLKLIEPHLGKQIYKAGHER